MKQNQSNWKESDINVDSLWLFPERDKSGKHNNGYHGNFIPQIPNQLLKRYTENGDLVLELFSGSGTTLFECEKLQRNYIGFDINETIVDEVYKKMADNGSILFDIHNCDVCNTSLFNHSVAYSLKKQQRENCDFLIAHPPYLDIVKFTEKKEDLSQISDIKLFIPQFIKAIGNGIRFLAKGKYFAIVIGDIYKKSEVIPLGFYTMDAVKRNFQVKLKGIIVKDIHGNRGKLGVQNIWRYRALNSDYFLFKHEYIFVFKKEF